MLDTQQSAREGISKQKGIPFFFLALQKQKESGYFMWGSCVFLLQSELAHCLLQFCSFCKSDVIITVSHLSA